MLHNSNSLSPIQRQKQRYHQPKMIKSWDFVQSWRCVTTSDEGGYQDPSVSGVFEDNHQ